MGDKTATLVSAGKALDHHAGDQLGQKSPNPLLGMQQSLGNQAMLRLFEFGVIQAKLRVSQPGDADEKEADRVAERVVSVQASPAIQRKCACGGSAPCAKCAEEEESIHRSVAGTIHRESRPSIQRLATDQAQARDTKTNDSSAAQGAAREKRSLSLIVEDDAGAAAPGQMKKSQFIQQLRTGVCATADAALAAVGRNSKSCPYIAQWLGFYLAQSADRIERAINKYAPETAGATRAQDYFSIINDRVRQAVTVWAKTGRVTGVPAGAPFLPGSPGGGGVEAPPASGVNKPSGGSPGAAGPSSSILTKSRDTGPPGTADPDAVKERLGTGRALDSGVRSRMESAFGHDFSSVRLHTDSSAAQLSTELNARAFTIGENIAFDSREYKPGTLVGDALIAHELAHVVQQGGAEATAPSRSMEQDRGLEEDADDSAAHAVASIFTRGRASLGRIGARVAPALKSGLRLQRCQEVVKVCPKGYSWRVKAMIGVGPGCVCKWKCMPGEDPRTPPPPSPQETLRCPSDMDCSTGTRYEELDDSYEQTGGGGHMTPLDGEPFCGCFPLTKDGKVISNSPLGPSDFEMTDVLQPLADAAAARRSGARPKTDPTTGTRLPEQKAASPEHDARPTTSQHEPTAAPGAPPPTHAPDTTPAPPPTHAPDTTPAPPPTHVPDTTPAPPPKQPVPDETQEHQAQKPGTRTEELPAAPVRTKIEGESLMSPEQKALADRFDKAETNAVKLRNEKRDLEIRQRDLANMPPEKYFKGRRQRMDEIAERLREISIELPNVEKDSAAAEKALEDSSLSLYQKLSIAGRRGAAYERVASQAHGVDQVSGLKTSNITVDHLVSIKRISGLPGFARLSWENQLAIINTPRNLIAMDGPANSSKGASSWEDWTHAADFYPDAKVRSDMVAREKTVLQEIQDQIVAAPKVR